jgi:imidazolonepropionase-like amidohydrolase
MADLVVVDGDPSEDITVLRRVLAVYRSGRLVSK